MRIDFKQATQLLELFGGGAAEVILIQVDKECGGNWHSGEGLYAYYEACPEEGAVYLGITDEDAEPGKEEA